MAATISTSSTIPRALASFLAERPGEDCYLIEYIDYRSADGHFRKYRFIFVDADILPYHLAIGSDWKLHHEQARTWANTPGCSRRSWRS